MRRRRARTPGTARWPPSGARDLLITQNVDGLHEAGRHARLVALHGRISDVVCLGCRATSAAARAAGSGWPTLNPGFAERHAAVAARPDGDVDLDETSDFVVPVCEACGGRSSPTWCSSARTSRRRGCERSYDAVDALVGARRGAAGRRVVA